MLALDVARTEAGLLLLDVDYIGSRKALISSQRYTPYEMGLSRLVSLDKGPFVGRAALAEERRRGPRRQIAGLEIEWSEVESIHERLGLAPVAPAATSRVPVPIMRGNKQIGRATTTAWSPTLKRLIALATIDSPHYEEGARVQFEITVEGARHFVGARVVQTPFFNPPRKTATPPA
jgi:aminomethyltransferase